MPAGTRGKAKHLHRRDAGPNFFCRVLSLHNGLEHRGGEVLPRETTLGRQSALVHPWGGQRYETTLDDDRGLLLREARSRRGAGRRATPTAAEANSAVLMSRRGGGGAAAAAAAVVAAAAVAAAVAAA